MSERDGLRVFVGLSVCRDPYGVATDRQKQVVGCPRPHGPCPTDGMCETNPKAEFWTGKPFVPARCIAHARSFPEVGEFPTGDSRPRIDAWMGMPAGRGPPSRTRKPAIRRRKPAMRCNESQKPAVRRREAPKKRTCVQTARRLTPTGPWNIFIGSQICADYVDCIGCMSLCCRKGPMHYGRMDALPAILPAVDEYHGMVGEGLRAADCRSVRTEVIWIDPPGPFVPQGGPGTGGR
jgi:hypothetical protein